jgi:aspartyl aminopeptidase
MRVPPGMSDSALNQQLINFIQRAPTPFHATAELARQLREAGFVELQESDRWTLESGGRYLVTRNASSIIAFAMPEGGEPSESGLRMVGAHTDSPCLRVKPEPHYVNKGYYQLGVEVYGGALLNPWFDRDLSLAGRVSYRSSAQRLGGVLVNFQRPIAVIPSLAIHLDREVNNARSINAQQHLPPVLMRAEAPQTADFRELLLTQARQEHPDLDIEAVLDFELCFYDCQPAAVIGFKQDFIAGGRLDNLLSCFIAARALLESRSGQGQLIVCTDHEEVGSTSACGADGPFLKSVLERICPDTESLARCIDRSWLISADNAHGVHPNYADKYDANHGPLLNGGPVIKVNANQRYATNSETAALFRLLCEQAAVPIQSFVVRSDMACGSTIGPLTAGNIGVRTLDVGVPTFAMHSIRELAGAHDTRHLLAALAAFFAYGG